MSHKRWHKYCDPNNWHYAANVFPLMDRDELEALAVDIKTNGLLNSVIRCGGKVLDGRNRILACRLVEVDPYFRDVSVETGLAWAASQNYFRRHLRPEQGAFALQALNVDRSSYVGNKERVRAYKKLAQAKEAAEELTRDIKSGLEAPKIVERIKQIFKKEHTRQEMSVFEELAHLLNTLVPTISDGREHRLVAIFVEAINLAGSTELNDNDKAWLEEIIFLLDKLSIDFAAYADKLSSKQDAEVA